MCFEYKPVRAPCMAFSCAPWMVRLIVVVTLSRRYISRHFQNVLLFAIAQCQRVLVIYRNGTKLHWLLCEQIWREKIDEFPQKSKTIHWKTTADENKRAENLVSNFPPREIVSNVLEFRLFALLLLKNQKSFRLGRSLLTVNHWYNSSSNVRRKLFQ